MQANISRIAVITGASSGIGKELAIQLAKDDVQVVLAARNADRLSKLEQNIKSNGGKCIAVPTDVSKPEDINYLKEKVSDLGTINILINNAGVGYFGPLEELSIEDWNCQINVNLRASFLLSQAFVPSMKMKKKGIIVFINSIAGRQPFSESVGYAASKFGLRGLANSLREELRGDNIKIISIFPGAIDTSFWDKIDSNFSRDDMLNAKDLAKFILHSINAPGNLTVEEMVIRRIEGDF